MPDLYPENAQICYVGRIKRHVLLYKVIFIKCFRQRWFWGVRNQALAGNASKPKHHGGAVAQIENRDNVTRKKTSPLRSYTN
jgi:hypothetical protein